MRGFVPGLLMLASLLGGCGDGSSSNGGGSGGGGGPVNPPVVVNVASGATSSGVDINVVGPASTSPPNAEDLGVTPVGTSGTAFNTGASIRRGAVMDVLLFGQGLSGSMQVSISGEPSDFIIANIHSISATDQTPGVEFTVTVSPGAALGARTVVLQAPNNDITTFTGGLEVVP